MRQLWCFINLYCSPALVCHISHTWWVWSCFISFRLWKREFSTAKQFGQWRSFKSNGETCGIRNICMSIRRWYQWSLHCSLKKRNRIVLECLHFHYDYFVSMTLIWWIWYQTCVLLVPVMSELLSFMSSISCQIMYV